MALALIEEMCLACGDCVDVCPSDVLKLEGMKLSINQEECSECGACESECPQGALKLD